MNTSPFRISVLTFLLVLATRTFCQTPDTATLQGEVFDPGNRIIPGAQIKMIDRRTGVERNAQSDSLGKFTRSGLPIGTYTVAAHKEGFAEARREVTLLAGTTANVRFQLNVSQVTAEILVTGVAGEVRTDEPQLAERFGPAEVEQTPLLNRRITYLPLLNAANRPALNQGDAFTNQSLFTTNGSGRRQTAWVVDGGTGNDSWGRQTIFTNVPQVAVQEISVLESAFSADYGATTGGVVNVVTKTGGNQYHGDVLTLWRPNATAAKLAGFTSRTATSGNQIVSDSLGQLGASFSGPLSRMERTYFFLAGEYSRQNRGSPVTSPIAPGVFVGHYTGWMTFLRVDRQINEANNLFFRANTDSFHDSNPNGAVGGNNLPTVDRIFRRRAYSTALGETAVLEPSLLNTVRAQFQLASPITQFQPVVFGTQFVVPISTGGTFTTGTSQSALLLNRQYSFNDTLAAAWGSHQLRFGVDVLRARNGGNGREFGGPIFLGQLTYNTCTQALTVCESSTYLNDIANVRSYTQSYGRAAYSVDDTLWGLFVQDNYKVRGHLTLDLGLRYEQQTFTDARKNLGPRLGLAYDWHGQGLTVFRAGFGLYYAQVINNAAANYSLSGPTGTFNFTATPGQMGFPTSVSAVPLPAFPAGAVAPVRSLYIRPGRRSFYNQFFPTDLLKGYPQALLNPYSEQWTLGIERRFGKGWLFGVDYLGAHTVHIVRPLDVDSPAPFLRTAQGQMRGAQAANCTRPLWVNFYAGAGRTCDPANPHPPQPLYALIQTDVNNGFAHYHALNLNLSHQWTDRLTTLVSYVYSHSTDNVDPDVPGGDPNDPNFTAREERGNAIFDQRHRLVLSGTIRGPLGIHVGGVTTIASGLPFNFVTGTNNSGDTGATADRPVIHGLVVPRNAGRGRATYDFSPFLEKDFPIQRERLRLRARVEAFNVFNHPNFVGFSGTYGNAATPGPGFGQPLTGIANQLPARSLQFALRLLY